MQPIVFEDRYEFIPPHRGRFWPWLLERISPWLVRKYYGIHGVECRGVENLTESLAAGHGIILVPNHSRPSDPTILGELARSAGTHLYAMASWSAFKQSSLQTFLVRRMGGFSVYREGMDRRALDCAIKILSTGERPLVVFAEGMISRTNDHLGLLQEGAEFLARAAMRASSRNGDQRQSVIHPVAIKYRFDGDLEASVEPVLDEIERRLSWSTSAGRPLRERIDRIGAALLTLKELEYFDEPYAGPMHDRAGRLVERLLSPLETEWSLSSTDDDVVSRVKKIRTAILPDMVTGELSESERQRRWRQLAECYLAQQLSLYPRGYLDGCPSRERLLETVERLEEDLTDTCRIHAPFHAVIQVGESVSVSSGQRGDDGTEPVMMTLERRLNEMLVELGNEIRTGRSR